MKSIFKFGLLFISIICYTTNSFAQEWYKMKSQDYVKVEDVQKAAEKYFDSIGTGKHTGYKLYSRWLDNATRHMDKDGYLYTSNHISQELKTFKQNISTRSQKTLATTNSESSWFPVGPFDIKDNNSIGRVTAIAVEPIDQQLLFIGSPGGGIWRSRDAGESWVPVGDNLVDLDIWAIAINPNNVNHILHTNKSSNLLESFDQGDTWTEKVTNNISQDLTRMIKFHPTIDGTYFYTSKNGIYKNTNGAPTLLLNENIEDVFFKPGDPSTMYACGDDFWKSTNTGNSWTKITNGIVQSERMKMTVTEADPNRVYIVQSRGSQFGRIYKSTNAGDSFTIMSDIEDGADSYLGLQAWRDMAIMCSNTNPEQIHMGGLRYHRSPDGGATFEELSHGGFGSDQTSYIHPDVEVMIAVNETLYAGTDGGIFRSTNEGDNMTGLHGNGLMITQIYRIGGTAPNPGNGENSDPDMIMCGTQDNGTMISKEANHNWDGWIGSDGMECFIDYTDDNILYGTKQFGKLYISTDGGLSNRLLTAPESRGNWVTPFEMDPRVPTTLYVGFSEVYKSTNSGTDWAPITSGQTNNGLIHEIKIAPSDNNYIYFSEDEKLWVSTNAQSNNITWREISGIEAINFVRYITVDPNDPLHVIVTGTRVLESKDAGLTWNDITGNLPDIGANCIVMDNTDANRIYIGMQKGIYYKDDTMTDWKIFGNDLPNCDITELEINYQGNKLKVATYGRGIWEIDIFDDNNNTINPKIITETSGGKCPGEVIKLSVENDASWETPITYQWFNNQNLIFGATSFTYDATEQGNYVVKVTANGVSGTSAGTQVNFLETPASPTVKAEQLCGGGTVTLTATGTGNGLIKWYTDSSGINEIAEGNTYSVDINQTSTFYVKELSNITNCFSASNKATAIVLRPLDTPEVNDETICAPGEVILTATTAENGTIRWYTNENPTEVIQTGNTLTTNIENTTTFLVDVNPESMDKDCASLKALLTVTMDECLGLTTFENENLKLYPNPSNGVINLELPQGFNLQSIEIIDILGKSLKSYDQYPEQINLENYSSGTYLIKVTSDKGNKVFKVLVP